MRTAVVLALTFMCVPAALSAALESGPSAAIANMAGNVQFTWTREAGTFRFSGSFDQGRGSGTYGFTPDQTFVNNMANAGYRNLAVDDIVRLAVIDMTIAHARGLTQAGYANLPLDDLIRTRIHKVTPEFIKASDAASRTRIRRAWLRRLFVTSR